MCVYILFSDCDLRILYFLLVAGGHQKFGGFGEIVFHDQVIDFLT